MAKLLRIQRLALVLTATALPCAVAATPAQPEPCIASDKAAGAGISMDNELQHLREQTTTLKDDLERVLQALGRSAKRVRRLEKDLASADRLIEPILIPPSY